MEEMLAEAPEVKNARALLADLPMDARGMSVQYEALPVGGG
jgi:hypothetical protein